MSNFFTLSCPTCGAKLQIENDLQRFACAFCGNEHIVRRDGSTVSLLPVFDAVERIQAGVDRTAIELTIARIEREIKAGRDAPDEIDAIKDYYTIHPNEPNYERKNFWQDNVALHIQKKRNPNHRNSVFGKVLNVWDGGMTYSDLNNIIRTLTLDEINDVLQWLNDPNFPRKNSPSYLDLVQHVQRLKALEESRASIPSNEAELQKLKLLLKS